MGTFSQATELWERGNSCFQLPNFGEVGHVSIDNPRTTGRAFKNYKYLAYPQRSWIGLRWWGAQGLGRAGMWFFPKFAKWLNIEPEESSQAGGYFINDKRRKEGNWSPWLPSSPWTSCYSTLYGQRDEKQPARILKKTVRIFFVKFLCILKVWNSSSRHYTWLNKHKIAKIL